MKKLIAILLMFTVTCGVYASYFEVQVPMSDKHVYGERTTLTTGHFQTTVNTLDASGRAYAPGQGAHYAPGGPRRVQGEDEDDDRETEDPFFDQVQPIGDTPWFFMCMCACALAFIIYRRTRKQS